LSNKIKYEFTDKVQEDAETPESLYDFLTHHSEDLSFHSLETHHCMMTFPSFY